MHLHTVQNIMNWFGDDVKGIPCSITDVHMIMLFNINYYGTSRHVFSWFGYSKTTVSWDKMSVIGATTKTVNP